MIDFPVASEVADEKMKRWEWMKMIRWKSDAL